MTSQVAVMSGQNLKSQMSVSFLMTELGVASVMIEEIHLEGVALDTHPMTIHARGTVTRGARVNLALTTVSLRVTPSIVTTQN